MSITRRLARLERDADGGDVCGACRDRVEVDYPEGLSGAPPDRPPTLCEVCGSSILRVRVVYGLDDDQRTQA